MPSDYLWWRDGVIYQIYPRSFADSNGDGLGDLPGLTARLDYLKALGVDALWLSPIYPSPMRDFGYDVSDYENIDSAFGTLADFDELVNAAHARGLHIVMDFVVNHSSDEHAWFRESRASRDNPKRDWYLWRDPQPDELRHARGRVPNNWQAVFGGQAWEWDEHTRQYYYHMFLKEQPDLNWRNSELRAAVFQSIKFWLDRGVDGFRLDVVNAYFKDAQLRDNPPALGLRPYDRQRHLYDCDQPELIGVYQELRRLLDAYPERMAVGEIMGANPDLIARYCGEDKLHLAFDFHLLHQPWFPRAIQNALARSELTARPDLQPCYALSNHDVDRHATRYGGGPHSDARAKVAATLLLTTRATPFLYYGEELGMQNTPIPRAEIQDPPGKRYWPFYSGRDPERTPMPWSAEVHAGFTTSQPWLRLNADYLKRNVAAQSAAPNSVLNFYTQLLQLRRESLALRRGSYRALIQRPITALAYLRRVPEQALLIALNFFAWETKVTLAEPLPSARWKLRLTTAPGERRRLEDQQLTLAPFEACILEAE
jgi:alpha-glucosidase